MTKRTELYKAQIIAKSARTPLGPLPAERILRDHIDTIEEWRRHGASWDQIAALLGEAGWRSCRSDIIGADQIRAMVSRIRKALQRPVVKAASLVSPPTLIPASDIGTCVTYHGSLHPVPSQERADVAARIRRAAALRSEQEER